MRKRLCHYRKIPEKEIYPKNLRRLTLSKKDGVYEFWWNSNNASKGGSTPDLQRRSMDFEKTPNLTYFLLASPNLEDEIHFKGGRSVTSQNSTFWNVIINK